MPANPTGVKPKIAQTVQQKAQQAAQSAKQGAVRETQQMLHSAQSQIAGADKAPQPSHMDQAPGIGQSNPQLPQQHDSTEAYRAKVKSETDQRMIQLKNLIDQEIEKSRQEREQRQQATAQAQAQQMQEMNQEKEEEKQGFIAVVSKATKRVRGRLGQIQGQGKGEKGRAAKG